MLRMFRRVPMALSAGVIGNNYIGSLTVGVNNQGRRQVLKSEDSLIWTTAWTDTVANGGFEDVCYGDGLFIAVSSTTGIYSSPDGITWTMRKPASNIVTVAFGNGIFLASGDNGYFYKSTDGITWTNNYQAPMKINGANVGYVLTSRIYFDGEVFRAKHSYSSYMFSSLDGNIFAAPNTSDAISGFGNVIKKFGTYFIVGTSYGKIYKSTNGNNWTLIYTLNDGSSIAEIELINNVLVCFAADKSVIKIDMDTLGVNVVPFTTDIIRTVKKIGNELIMGGSSGIYKMTNIAVSSHSITRLISGPNIMRMI